ncbi:hypothetical protein Tco_0379756, partial [Tanacetum coccineum]
GSLKLLGHGSIIGHWNLGFRNERDCLLVVVENVDDYFFLEMCIPRKSECACTSEILWPRTMPSLTIKWLFSQLRLKLVSSHLLSMWSKRERQFWKEFPKTEKSSIKTSIVFSTMS